MVPCASDEANRQWDPGAPDAQRVQQAGVANAEEVQVVPGETGSETLPHPESGRSHPTCVLGALN